MYGEKQKSHIVILLQEKYNLTKINANLQEEVTLLNSKLEAMTKSICMLNCGSEILYGILGAGEISRDMRIVSFDYSSMN